MSPLWGPTNPKDEGEGADLESEREALRRQRLEAARELEGLKQALAERVAGIQARERELEQALARAERGEGDEPASGGKLESVRLRLAEAREARAARADERDQAAFDALRTQLDAREAMLADRERELEIRTAGLDAASEPESDAQQKQASRAKKLAAREARLKEREAELEARTADLDRREQEAAAKAEPEPAAEPEPEPDQAPAPSPDELERLEAKLAELREAEQAFARTQAELAIRSDALTEREEALSVRERALAAREAPPASELGELEARIRRLEQGPRGRTRPPQTFSSGLKSLEQRGLRGSDGSDEPLH